MVLVHIAIFKQSSVEDQYELQKCVYLGQFYRIA